MRYALRQSRLKMTISHLISESEKFNQNVETLHTLRDSREVKFVAKREHHHIIPNEAAWHAVWIRKDNEYKHNDHKRYITELEENLNDYRDLTKMFAGTKITAYDLAHKAVEFAEQTLAVFVKIARLTIWEVLVTKSPRITTGTIPNKNHP